MKWSNCHLSLLSLLIITIMPIYQSCLLCYFRLPKRPKTIDYLWPTIFENINFPETATEMCEVTERLPFTAKCRKDLAKIFCSLSNFTDVYWQECNLENVEYEQCMNCSRNKINITRQTSWVITCMFYLSSDNF